MSQFVFGKELALAIGLNFGLELGLNFIFHCEQINSQYFITTDRESNANKVSEYVYNQT